MIKNEREDGRTDYVLTKRDVMDIFAAHMERGTGKAFEGGCYEAAVDMALDQLVITVRRTPRNEGTPQAEG